MRTGRDSRTTRSDAGKPSNCSNQLSALSVPCAASASAPGPTSVSEACSTESCKASPPAEPLPDEVVVVVVDAVVGGALAAAVDAEAVVLEDLVEELVVVFSVVFVVVVVVVVVIEVLSQRHGASGGGGGGGEGRGRRARTGQTNSCASPGFC